MSYFTEVTDDLVESWDSDSCSDFDDDMDLIYVPDFIEVSGSEAVDNFIHNKVMKNMDKGVYNGS